MKDNFNSTTKNKKILLTHRASCGLKDSAGKRGLHRIPDKESLSEPG
jgi:hypothetical protein